MGQVKTIPNEYTEAHRLARQRFKINPSKCYQRHIREVWGEIEKRAVLTDVKKSKVRQITRSEAESIILKYEWLAADPNKAAPLGRGISAYYGLIYDDELIGASCWGKMGKEVGLICYPEAKANTVCLMRGACVPHAPKNAASFFTQRACLQAYKDFGWEVVFAYSDTDEAGEMGTVYQACGWYYLGQGLGRGERGVHCDYLSPDKTRLITSYQLNHQGAEKKLMKSFGWSPEVKVSMRRWLREVCGWEEIQRKDKKKWVTFVGKRKNELMKMCRFTFQPYPKRCNKATDDLLLLPKTVSSSDLNSAKVAMP
jgi:hypothetical protein